MIRELPPGPRRSGVRDYLREIRSPYVIAVEKGTEAMNYGDIASYFIGPRSVIQLNHPDLVQDAFLKNAGALQRGDLDTLRWTLGEGLLLSRGAAHRPHRRALQPEFKRHRVAMYCSPMAASVEKHISGWEDGQRVRFHRSMSQLGIDMTAKTLFGLELSAETEQLGHEFERIIKYMFERQIQPKRWRMLLHWLPLPRSREYHRLRGRLDDLIYGLIEERRESGYLNDDMLTVLVQQQLRPDEDVDIYALMAEAEAAGESPDAPSANSEAECPVRHEFWEDRQIRDEAVNFLLAGQESFHNVCSWIIHYLSVMPDLQERLHREVDEALEGRLVDFSDFPNLPFLDKLIREGLRLRAPVSTLARVAQRDITVGGYLIPEGQMVAVSIFNLHRMEEFYPDPETFNPDRWTDEFQRGLHRCAYLPFAIGAHRCIGEQFAWMQLRLTLATIAQRFWVHPDPDHTVRPRITFTTSFDGGLPVYVQARKT